MCIITERKWLWSDECVTNEYEAWMSGIGRMVAMVTGMDQR